ncbi:nuclear transport factor 2 family protein [Rhodococcus sp. 05-339-2]|uniref:nuclear transport factor 2 family protein n=1 Tax=Rhodococcoides fascians TaxID=1828 RepID=UPI0009EA2FD1|nr:MULTISPECIES: nuclear transport factor 2 family protein [Rhodococcus]OZD79318.1 nuclear transport factor 2 family protein [Rhodococcus sp. 05-339-2]
MATTEARNFVDAFTGFLSAPSSARLTEILHDDVVLVQPLSRRLDGIRSAQYEFDGLWGWMPDLLAEVVRWHGDAEVVFIELRLHASWGGRHIEWPCVDRLLLRDGRAAERHAFFDPLPLVLPLIRHPSVWRSWWRSGGSRPWRYGHTSPYVVARSARGSAS